MAAETVETRVATSNAIKMTLFIIANAHEFLLIIVNRKAGFFSVADSKARRMPSPK